MKPQEIFVALKLLAYGRKPWNYEEIAQSLKISPSNLHRSVKALAFSGLFIEEYKCLNNSLLEEFLLHGVKVVFPVKAGGVVRGMLTAHSAPAFKDSFKPNPQDAYVWPDANSENKGFSVEPLYKAAPAASSLDADLYGLLACVDVLRIGKARERNIAVELLKKAFADYGKLP
ncbi:MAG: hypothetical protein A2268_15255 [Candidatus Raymondbacteria bacterium RifOxyA12_full_50_37]|uniref:HTH iclR-type domain-containing protein n=1 Tax=Candidatus Raymondbacteria bacterium RIFOXYD12_FULL_49_13 TaxID=1817890 RepID=A0A1F7F703_UNCRA|nr:MAG: hypothetical protein A2268_15255 [Candidatus Raymondbacteria bacterium RifOxyA12_full_50_37]OGJ88488.1 MAG: hypothetical protein A2248_20010 [Candidatus Raymondbacteria bacterium RIFOXYA2_FULL_49_16]OGJ90630.1 MAG: hypothetical protein A2350_18505 [Candidatus Raymondbacteria bacterium RifOxyB12_full_50_8]OGJ96200.1 MAG: hypothetical protein A2487_01435 [Candidatus Raymondbacteria bacterium RifOxyC12_full_50_8]OGJ98948.1 MAG: hypothetical protein A2453_10725 [Candidatus Raymondbacteria b